MPMPAVVENGDVITPVSAVEIPHVITSQVNPGTRGLSRTGIGGYIEPVGENVLTVETVQPSRPTAASSTESDAGVWRTLAEKTGVPLSDLIGQEAASNGTYPLVTSPSSNMASLNHAINLCITENPHINRQLMRGIGGRNSKVAVAGGRARSGSMVSMRPIPTKAMNQDQRVLSSVGFRPTETWKWSVILRKARKLLFGIYIWGILSAFILSLLSMGLSYVPWVNNGVIEDRVLVGLGAFLIVLYFVGRFGIWGVCIGFKVLANPLFVRCIISGFIFCLASLLLPFVFGIPVWKYGLDLAVVAICIITVSIVAIVLYRKLCKKKKLAIYYVLVCEILHSALILLFPYLIVTWYASISDMYKFIVHLLMYYPVREIGLVFGRHHARRYRFVSRPHHVHMILFPYMASITMYGKFMILLIDDWYLFLACVVSSVVIESLLKWTQMRRDIIVHKWTHNADLAPYHMEFLADNRVPMLYVDIENAELVINIIANIVIPSLLFFFQTNSAFFFGFSSPFDLFVLKALPVFGFQLCVDFLHVIIELRISKVPRLELWQRNISFAGFVRLFVLTGAFLCLFAGQIKLSSPLAGID